MGLMQADHRAAILPWADTCISPSALLFRHAHHSAEAAAKGKDRINRRVQGHIEAEQSYGKRHKGLCGRSAYGVGGG